MEMYIVSIDQAQDIKKVRPLVDGNGLRYHRAFWPRRQWTPKCTNKDEQRPRLVYISNCQNVRIENVRLQNAAF